MVENPTGVEGYLRLGLSYYQKEDYQASVPLLEKAVLLQPTNYEANFYLGYSHYYLKQFQPAAVALRAAAANLLSANIRSWPCVGLDAT